MKLKKIDFTWLKKIYSIKFLLLVITISLVTISFIQIKKWEVQKKKAQEQELLLKQKESEKKENETLLEPIKWPTQTLNHIGIDSVIIVTKFINGKILFRINASTKRNFYSQIRRDYENMFTLIFLDKDQFPILKEPLYSNNYVQVVNSENKTEGFYFDGKSSISKNDYKRIKSVSILNSIE